MHIHKKGQYCIITEPAGRKYLCSRHLCRYLCSHSPPSVTHTQEKFDASLLQLNEMQGQRSMFEGQLAETVSAASDQRTHFDTQMARAGLDADVMRSAYDKLSSSNVEQQKTAAQV